MTNKEVGEMIRTMRMSRSMTQSQLADAVGMSPSAIAMYESGKRRPKDEAVEALADVFNVPKWAILYNEDEMVPAQDVSADEKWRDKVPHTSEARMISAGVDRMPEEKRKRAFELMELMFSEYYKEEQTDDT